MTTVSDNMSHKPKQSNILPRIIDQSTFKVKMRTSSSVVVMHTPKFKVNPELVAALFALSSRLESATEESDCRHTVIELSAWLRDEGYDIDLIAQFFLENPCSAAPWVSPELLISTYTMAVKSKSEVITFVDQLDQQVPGFSQAAFAVIDSLQGTTQDLIATAGGLSGKTATFLKQHPVATAVVAAVGLDVTKEGIKYIRRRLAERAANALEAEAPRLEHMVDHAAVNVASEEMRNPAVIRQVERAELEPIREAEDSARFFGNVEIDTDLSYFAQARIVGEKATSLAEKHLDTYLGTITEELRQADKASANISSDHFAKFDEWRSNIFTREKLKEAFTGKGLNELEKFQKLSYKETDQYREYFNKDLDYKLGDYKRKLANAYKASLRNLDDEAMEAADTAEKRLALAAENNISELEVAVEKDVLKTTSRAAIEFEEQLAKDIASATEKADSLIDDAV